MFDFSIVTNWIHELLLSVMPEGWAIFIECIAVGVCIVALYAILAIVLIYMERKVCGFFQCRLGPNRVGKWGSIQVICDVLKMLTKEIFTPKDADRFLYNLAPFMVIIASFLTFACIPFNKGAEILNFNVGVFFLLAASSIGVVGILLAGWGSNNKFSLIGAMRSGAQIISYELSVGMSIMTMVVLMGTMQFSEVDVIPGLGNEIYASLLGLDESSRVVVKVSVEPLVNWLWIGGTIMCLVPLAGLRRRKNPASESDSENSAA